MRVPGRQTLPPLRSWPSAWCEAWDADMAPHPGSPGQTLKMRDSGRKVGLPAVRLNVLPFCDACTGENQFSTDPTTGICRNTPCRYNRCSRPSSGGQLPARVQPGAQPGASPLPEAAPHLPSAAEPELPGFLSEPLLSCFPEAVLRPRKALSVQAACWGSRTINTALRTFFKSVLVNGTLTCQCENIAENQIEEVKMLKEA